ncbi:MAG: HNH endonuclease [Haemophilus parainfluenzae]|nr:HNH endonuclease [Haemophilus parainfluenzae]
MKSAPTKDYLSECFTYNENTGLLTWKERPLHHFKKERDMNVINGRMAGKPAKSSLNGRYHVVFVNGNFYLCHRVVWCLHHGYWPECDIDHINGNKLDNRIENLREVSRSQNMSNVGMQSNNKSGFIGVFWASREGKWQAVVAHNKKNILLGRFDCPVKAALAYNDGALKYHGSYAQKKVDINKLAISAYLEKSPPLA